MTQDELVKFAVIKLGGDLLPKLVNGHPYMRLWSAKDEDYDMVRVNLSSPDLMLKGMGVCGYDVTISIGQADYEKAVCFMEGSRHEVWKFYRKPSDIPETFWTAWAELEGGQG